MNYITTIKESFNAFLVKAMYFFAFPTGEELKAFLTTDDTCCEDDAEPSRFDYIAYDDIAKDLQANFKRMFMEIESDITAFDYGRSRCLALEHLETAYMWIGKAIRDEQIERNECASLQEERNNS